MTTLREAIEAEANKLPPSYWLRRNVDTSRRDALLRYAYARGATVRQLCEAASIYSTSSVHYIVRGAQRPVWVDPLDQAAPDDDTLEADEQRHLAVREGAA